MSAIIEFHEPHEYVEIVYFFNVLVQKREFIVTVIQPAREARGGLFTDLTIYLYGGTSADLSKIPPLLGGIVICFRR